MSRPRKEKRWHKKRNRDGQQSSQLSGTGTAGLTLLVFVSGFASLVYQVLWMRQLGLLFGNTSQATAATLAVFFAGLGAGSWWWGSRIKQRPLRAYAWLELGIAAGALLYFPVLAGIHAAYGLLHAWTAATPWRLVVNLLLSLALVFPAAFFMGGTIPAIAQVAVRERGRFGSMSAWLYGINTLGAALGVLMAAFLLLPALGFRFSYALAVGCSLVVALIAWKASVEERPVLPLGADEADEGGRDPSGGLPPVVATLAFVSGFVVLALEVVWTRIFAQVHENSVYSFAVILAVVLLGLGLGAGISSLLARLRTVPRQLLMGIMLVAGGLLVLGPFLLMKATHDLQPVHTNESWAAYIGKLFKMGLGGVGYTVIALGVVFPFLMKMAERDVRVPGRMLGRLLAINTAGAILGSLVCGFVLLPLLGMWSTLRLLTVVHLLAALMISFTWNQRAVLERAAAVLLIILLFTLLDPATLRVVGQPPGTQPRKVLEVWEGSDCTVAAVEQSGGHRALLINASYSLGSTSAYLEQVNQSRIPLWLFPKTRSICYIGIGTGMSVGAALDKQRFPAVERVVACELSAHVVEAARKWIPEAMTGGMFHDERCTILIEDGRHHLMATRERYDMINADLFLPYRRGAGSLYALDHYRVVAKRLNPGGVFVQWLPLYQLTEFEFAVIARTMTEVFGEVTMWRNNFAPGHEKVALVARSEPCAVAVQPRRDLAGMREAVDGLEWWATTPDMVRVEAEAIPFFYAGNLGRAKALFADYPLNTDDHPVIEFQTPWRFREVAARDKVIWCVGPKLLAWIERLFEQVPADGDPLFEGHPESSLHLVSAGMAFHRAMVAKALGEHGEVEHHWQRFRREWASAAE